MGEQGKRAFRGLLLRVLLLGAAAVIIFTWVIGIKRMEGNSMFPHIKDGDLCISYKPERCVTGELVLYRQEGRMKVGRIAAMPGDTISFENGQVQLNGSVISETIPYETVPDETAPIKYPLTLKEGEYFILNDYRLDSEDSRSFGPIEKGALKGKLIFLLRRRGF